MKIFETKGLGGEKIGNCLGVANNAKEAWKIIYDFKDTHKNELKIETYDRIVRLEPRKLAIDFGDYSRFLLLESDNTELDLNVLEEVWHPWQNQKSK